MRFFLGTVLLGSTVMLSACATMSKEECKVADWRTVGYQDAASGQYAQLSDHAKSCSKVKIVPDKNQYMLGYTEGEKSYCTYDNGIKAGETNKYVNGLCSQTGLKASFSKGYEQGKKRRAKSKEIEAKQKHVAEIDKQLKDVTLKKVSLSVESVSMLYREKELLTKEIIFLEKELSKIK